MNDDQRAFVEDLGTMMERMGSTRMFGRVLGVLMITPDAELSAEELANQLHASRGSISQATRVLVERGFIRRRSRPGSRRDYFSAMPDAWVVAVRRSQHEAGMLQSLFRRGLAAMDDDASSAARRPLEHTIEFLDFWDEELKKFFAHWEAYAEHKHAPGNPDNPSDQNLRPDPRHS